MYWVVVYDIFNNKHEYEVPNVEIAREHAKRIITEGFWRYDGKKTEVFYPVHEIVKVKIYPDGLVE